MCRRKPQSFCPYTTSSIRVLADVLRTSPSQVVRVLEDNRGSKQLLQLLKLAELAGYRVTFTLKRKPAA